MARVLVFSVAAALIVVACGGGVESGPATGAPSGTGMPAGGADCSGTATYCDLRCAGKDTPLFPAPCALPACPCLAGITPRAEWTGTYFMPDKVHATNLVLEADGTFHWTSDGCELDGGDCGVWKRSQPHTIVLLPATGKTEFGWNGGVGTSPVTQMNVVGDPSGDLVMEIRSPGEKPLAQRWKQGRVCAVCGGATGPTGQKPCTEPVARRCR
jgi:hypothetical protein